MNQQLKSYGGSVKPEVVRAAEKFRQKNIWQLRNIVSRVSRRIRGLRLRIARADEYSQQILQAALDQAAITYALAYAEVRRRVEHSQRAIPVDFSGKAVLVGELEAAEKLVAA